MKKLNNKKGISLIVLVITIIVMIILAAAIILSLQSSGIIGKANEAKAATTEANMLQAANIAYGEYILENNLGNIEDKTADSYVKDKLRDQDFKEEQLKKLSILEDGTIQILPTIPTGFVASIYSGEQKISDGLVVYKTTSLDGVEHQTAMETYDQYVWIPVEDSFDTVNWRNLEDFQEEYTEPYESGYDNEIAEYNKMKASVEKYGGFYIARYEAGKEDTGEIVSKKGKNVETVAWGTDMADAGTSGAVYLSKSLYPENSTSNVVSTLCYGVQWDAVMNFMKDVPNLYVSGAKYIEFSIGMGHYDFSFDSDGKSVSVDGPKVQPSGYYAVKNIYDMAGNVSEWTMESYDMTISNKNYIGRVARGGHFGNVGSSYSAFDREISGVTSSLGFRIALYLK